MKITFLFLAFAFAHALAFSQTTYSKETLEKIKEVENNITGNLILNDAAPSTIVERMAKYHVKGMSVAVIDDYKIVWAKGYGWADEAEKKPVTPETLFEPGSISKTLNALGILKLAQEKKIDLDADINTYLTSWKFPYDSLSQGKKITLRHILSHQAGLTVHGFPGHPVKGPIPTVYEVLDGKKPAFTPAVRSQFEPGLKYQYSGGGTTISQVILTDLTAKPYEVWMYENVLKPIGMVNSFYNQPPAKEKQALCATAYEDGKALEGYFHVYPEQAAAGLWMTPGDLCRYIIDMQLAYKGGSSKVLSPEMVKLHLTPYNNGPAALGTFIEDHEGVLYFQHSAGNDGFSGIFYGSLEDGKGAVLFFNASGTRLMNEVLNSIAKTYQWKNFYSEPRRKKSMEVPEATLKALEGVYLYEKNWGAIVKKDGTYCLYADHQYSKIYFSSPTDFFNEEFLSEKSILKDQNGAITGYTRNFKGKQLPSATRLFKLDTLKMELRQFNDMGWFFLENKDYNSSITYYQRGLQVYPNDLGMLSNMAHAYLFNNDYEHAIAIYKAHLNDTIQPGYTWKKMMQEDLTYFKKNHYDTQPFEKVFAELKIEKPEGL